MLRYFDVSSDPGTTALSHAGSALETTCIGNTTIHSHFVVVLEITIGSSHRNCLGSDSVAEHHSTKLNHKGQQSKHRAHWRAGSPGAQRNLRHHGGTAAGSCRRNPTGCPAEAAALSSAEATALSSAEATALSSADATTLSLAEASTLSSGYVVRSTLKHLGVCRMQNAPR